MSTTHSASQLRAAASDVPTSAGLMVRARQSIAGGDNSTMRVLPYHLPLVASHGAGARVWDVEGNEYIDLNMAYGPLILGHCPPQVLQAVGRQLQNGTQLGFPAELSIRVAEKLRRLFPAMELLRFSSTGTEAVASALRLARTVTGRRKLIAFEGHYHGWSDAIFHRYHAVLEQLPAAGYGPALPGTLGMNGAPHDLLVVRWNDLEALHRCLAEHGSDVAAVIMEPIMGNAGVIPPHDQYLAGVREATLDHGILLVFDEVITGLRVAPGGAQEYYRVYPDITVVSKALGGGFPVSAFGAAREHMQVIANGSLFHGGVFSGNALVMAAAEAVLDEILANGQAMYEHLHALGDQLAGGVRDLFSRLRIPHLVQHVGPLISIFLTTHDQPRITNYRDARRYCVAERYIRFQHHMQRAGVYFHPNQFEPLFLSTAHTRGDLEVVLERMEDAARCCLTA